MARRRKDPQPQEWTNPFEPASLPTGLDKWISSFEFTLPWDLRNQEQDAQFAHDGEEYADELDSGEPGYVEEEPPTSAPNVSPIFELSDVPWFDGDRSGPAPPARMLSSREIYLTLKSQKGVMSAAARALGLSPQTLRRRIADDAPLRAQWEKVSSAFPKPMPARVTSPPPLEFMRLCTDSEIATFNELLNYLKGSGRG